MSFLRMKSRAVTMKEMRAMSERIEELEKVVNAVACIGCIFDSSEQPFDIGHHEIKLARKLMENKNVNTK